LLFNPSAVIPAAVDAALPKTPDSQSLKLISPRISFLSLRLRQQASAGTALPAVDQASGGTPRYGWNRQNVSQSSLRVALHPSL